MDEGIWAQWPSARFWHCPGINGWGTGEKGLENVSEQEKQMNRAKGPVQAPHSPALLLNLLKEANSKPP